MIKDEGWFEECGDSMGSDHGGGVGGEIDKS